jgi:hypothetical protein
MEVHELKEWMEDRFELSDRLIDSKLTAVNTCIEKLEKKVDAHDGWIRSVKAVWWVVGGLGTLVIGKWEIWNRWFGGK